MSNTAQIPPGHRHESAGRIHLEAVRPGVNHQHLATFYRSIIEHERRENERARQDYLARAEQSG
ncbi:MAG: hypothetical protein ACYC23_13665 [Limisphaerales bacterium]